MKFLSLMENYIGRHNIVTLRHPNKMEFIASFRAHVKSTSCHLKSPIFQVKRVKIC
jgi:hypothetical protein